MTIETSYSRKPVRFRFAGKATSAWKRQVLWRARARDPSHADELFIPRAHKNRTGEKTVCWLHIFGSFFLPKKNIAEISRWDPPSMVNQPSVNKCCYCCFLAWERGRERREKVIELGAPSVMMIASRKMQNLLMLLFLPVSSKCQRKSLLLQRCFHWRSFGFFFREECFNSHEIAINRCCCVPITPHEAFQWMVTTR